MAKAVELAKKISKNLEKNWLTELENINLHKIFSPVYRINSSIVNLNAIVAFIILAYDPQSQWLDLRKERLENKSRILDSLDIDISQELFQQILSNSHDVVNDAALNYLNDLTDWRWKTIFTLIDYHSNMIRFANQKTESEKTYEKIDKEGIKKSITEEYDIDLITKVNKQKGELLELAIQARQKADKLIAEIKKDFVTTDAAVQADFNFSFTDTAKEKIDILSWRTFIRGLNEKKGSLA